MLVKFLLLLFATVNLLSSNINKMPMEAYDIKKELIQKYIKFDTTIASIQLIPFLKNEVKLFLPNWVNVKDNSSESTLVHLLKNQKNSKNSMFTFVKFKNATKDDIKNIPKDILEENRQNGFKTKLIASTKYKNYGFCEYKHFLIKSEGITNRWESYTTIFKNDSLYMLIIFSNKDKMSIGEFLSELSMKVFCLERVE